MEWTQEERDKEQKRLMNAMPQKCPNCGRNWAEWDGSGLWRCWKEQGGCGYGMTNSPDDSENMQTRIRELLFEVDRLSDADARALDAEDRIAALIAQRDTARAEVEKLRERAAADVAKLYAERDESDRVGYARLQEIERLRAEVQSLRELVAECRPVVEAVKEMRRYEKGSWDDFSRAFDKVRAVKLPAMEGGE